MKRTIKHVIIHCAATPNGKDIKAIAIDAMHKERGFKRDKQAVRNFNPEFKYIGYHLVIEVDGTVVEGRGLEEVGAHVQGNNSNSIGICMIGTDKFTKAQWMALRSTIINLASNIQRKPIITADSALTAYKDMGISIKGHRDYSPDLNGDGQVTKNEWIKICPGFSVSDWINGGMMPLEGHIYV
jgi:N-acetylmuramoyl-L-alanine amidase